MIIIMTLIVLIYTWKCRDVRIKYYGGKRKREESEKYNNSASHLLSRYRFIFGELKGRDRQDAQPKLN